MPAPIPDTTREAILADIRTGQKSRAQIARDHSVSVGSITNIARRAGLTTPFDRSTTKTATEAATVDHAARRANLKGRWLDLADAALTQAAAELADASASQAATIAAIAIDKHRALDQHDSDTQGLAAVDAWLRDITGGGT